MKSVQQSAAMEKAQAYATKDPERIAEASRKLAELKIADAIERALAKAPDLTPDQVENLAALLRKHRPAALAKRGAK
jgi:DNA-directed RNA polymerase subunit F